VSRAPTRTGATEPIRVLAIDHTAGVAPYRRKFDALAALPGIDLTVFAPDRWVENYRTVRLSGSRERAQDRYPLRTGGVVWPGYGNRAFYVSGLLATMRRARPEIVHLWEEPFSFMALQALLARRMTAPDAKALFFTSDNLSRGFRYPYRPSPVYAAIERWVHGQCEAAGAVTEEVRDVLRSKGYRGPIDVLPHALDLADYPEPTHEARRAARTRLGGHGVVVGYAGRLLAMKGVDLLLRAAAPVLRGGNEATLVIAGEGPERERLRGLAAELGLGERARFVDPVPHEAMPDLLAGFDVTAMPSITTPSATEQFGRVAMEAMAAGSAVVVSSSGGLPSVVGDAGIVVPEGNVAALAEALHRLVRSPAERESLAARGRARVEARFTWDRIAEALAVRYAALTGRSPAPAA
jgi:glycosyltransferase involved in cell wall biosynthesis